MESYLEKNELRLFNSLFQMYHIWFPLLKNIDLTFILLWTNIKTNLLTLIFSHVASDVPRVRAGPLVLLQH